MQWRFNFLQDIQLYYKFLSGKITEKKGTGAGTVKGRLLQSQLLADWGEGLWK